MHDQHAYCGVLADYRGVLGKGCVVVEDGVIRAITGEKPQGARTYDYRDRGYIVAPGFIDLHVHLRGLNLSYKEDEASGTRAAAASGITLVVDMPNTSPRVSTPELVMAKLSAFSGSPVDYGLYSGIPDDPSLVGELLGTPIAGFKVYPEDLDYRYESLVEVLGRDVLVVVHPELVEALQDYSEDLESRSTTRGCHWEAAAVDYIAGLASKARIHVTHASCPSTVNRARMHGYTVDVTPHHLLLTAPQGGDCLYKVNPPLRGVAERTLLLQLLLEGTVDAIASDHAPHASWEKSEPLSCSPGIPWLEAWPWALFRLVASGGLSLGEYLYLTSRGPARILGLEDYGVLREGARGNLVVIDPGYKWRYPGPRYSKARYTPTIQLELVGAPVMTVVGGEPVYMEGEVVESRRSGVNPWSKNKPG
ncbi:MAG: dihydroorotase [Desulfurococcales archaeon]|nr:dihydroorotase [Desulfurococcales archaeon]